MTEEDDQRREMLIRRWARAAYWSPEEGVALAYNLDPTKVISGGGEDSGDRRIRASADACHVLELARRAVFVNALRRFSAPIRFMKWARSTGVEFHSDWWAAVTDDELVPHDAGEKSPVAPTPDLGTRERESLLKLVTGMAIKGYGWDPGAGRSGTVGEIAGDLAHLGISLDPDTIRKWLRAGAELLPPENGQDE
ncbi:MAG TPA: hypothetical protein PKA33_20270 [Amaricoccus sp.]|uniref:hypothetical protein n=1 Tax=Amaricoccus sp. TaxID=1872485 RepID=UPI002C5DF784|nr:hypothetical protein [Amaricoccus sp.]HMQ94296.1 hypothetical protein [Amaricoccus sp.]HMR54623.1 hypothetical protein [Amaricoccus sp.]HMU01669.1 hypothetical protein [Amaricoccus sp.]